MTLLPIKVPVKAKSRITQLVKEWGGEVITTKPKFTKKEALLKDLEDGLNDVKLIREGKIKSLTMADLVNGK